MRLTSCSSRAKLIPLNQGPATLTHSLPSDACPVAATWARAVCTFASSRHHSALGLKSPRAVAPFSFAVVIRTVHSVLFSHRSSHPGPGPRAYVDLTRSSRQRFSVRVRGRRDARPSRPATGCTSSGFRTGLPITPYKTPWTRSRPGPRSRAAWSALCRIGGRLDGACTNAV